MAVMLPAVVRDEANAVIEGAVSATSAPVHTLRFYHQTAQLLAIRSDAQSHDAGAAPGAQPKGRAKQMELPIPARVA
jgi:hypothetical protein